MDYDLTSLGTFLADKDAANTAWWTMFYTAVAASGSVITAFAAIYAACIAKKELSSWRDHEKQLQLVRLKRAVFSYRQAVESIIHPGTEKGKLNEELSSKMQPLLSEIFHELVLAGLDYKGCQQIQLFDALFKEHNLYKGGETSRGMVLKKAVDLQKSIETNI